MASSEDLPTVEQANRMLIEISMNVPESESKFKLVGEFRKLYDSLKKGAEDIKERGGMMDIPGEIEA